MREAFLTHSRCSSDLKKAATGRTFFSKHCELTEDKQVSRLVGSSRKTDHCTELSQRFEPHDVGYLPGASRGRAVGAHVGSELCNGHRPDLEPKKKLQSKNV